MRHRKSENVKKKEKNNSFTGLRSVTLDSANFNVADDGIGKELTIEDSFFKPFYLIGIWGELGTYCLTVRRKSKKIFIVDSRKWNFTRALRNFARSIHGFRATSRKNC